MHASPPPPLIICVYVCVCVCVCVCARARAQRVCMCLHECTNAWTLVYVHMCTHNATCPSSIVHCGISGCGLGAYRHCLCVCSPPCASAFGTALHQTTKVRSILFTAFSVPCGVFSVFFFTWVLRHSIRKSSATHSSQCVQCFCVCKQWYN